MDQFPSINVTQAYIKTLFCCTDFGICPSRSLFSFSLFLFFFFICTVLTVSMTAGLLREKVNLPCTDYNLVKLSRVVELLAHVSMTTVNFSTLNNTKRISFPQKLCCIFIAY